MLDDLKKDARERMAKCVQTFQADLKKLRTGRAHPSLIEHLKVDYYGSEVPLQQIASIAVEEGRKSNPKLEVGICGEHGGDPDSIAFCNEVGLDYVSCSPFRVPVARLAAAQAALAKTERDK